MPLQKTLSNPFPKLSDLNWDQIVQSGVKQVDNRPNTYWLIVKPFENLFDFFNDTLRNNFSITVVDSSSPFSEKITIQLINETLSDHEYLAYPLTDKYDRLNDIKLWLNQQRHNNSASLIPSYPLMNSPRYFNENLISALIALFNNQAVLNELYNYSIKSVSNTENSEVLPLTNSYKYTKFNEEELNFINTSYRKILPDNDQMYAIAVIVQTFYENQQEDIHANNR